MCSWFGFGLGEKDLQIAADLFDGLANNSVSSRFQRWPTDNHGRGGGTHWLVMVGERKKEKYKRNAFTN